MSDQRSNPKSSKNSVTPPQSPASEASASTPTTPPPTPQHLPPLREMITKSHASWVRSAFGPFQCWDDATTARRAIMELQETVNILIERANG